MSSEYYQAGEDSREDMLRAHVAQLKQELEQERANKKQLHHDKVREMKIAREKEQTAARDQLEALKLKLQKEKTQELKALRDDLTKDFKTQMKSTQKTHEEAMLNAKKSFKKDLQALKDKYKEEIRAQIEYEMRLKFEVERKKVAHEMFEMDHQLKKAGEKAANLTAADKIKGDALREKEKKHTSEMEKLHRQHHLHSRKQLEELEAHKRTIAAKEKEIVQISERLSRTQASQEQLEEELKRMKLADSWSRRSRSASPALSPSSSTDDLASSTKRERDMVIRNSELSFRVRILEDKIGSLTEDKTKLQEKLAKSESQLTPLRTQITKQGNRINDLNASLYSREKKYQQLSEENLRLKTASQHLEEELGRQRKNLQQQMSQSSTNRYKLQKFIAKNNELSTTNIDLADQVDELTDLNQSLNERLSLRSLPNSPSPLSPLHTSHTPLSPTPLSPTFSNPTPLSPVSDDDLMSSMSSSGLMEQLEFEKDEIQVKYDEMKSEYSHVKAKYNTLKATHDQLQTKHRELHSRYRQAQDSLELLKKEQLQLEHEVVLLRRVSQPSPFDRERHELVMEDLQEQLEDRDTRIKELEDFIIEQDEVSHKSEEVWQKEKRQLTQLLSQKQLTTPKQLKLKKISDQPLTNAEEALTQLEENAHQLREQLKDTRATSTVMDSKLKENEQLLAQTQDTVREMSDFDAALLAAEKTPNTSTRVSREEPHLEDGVPSSPLAGTQLQQYVEQCKSQIRTLEDENQALKNSLEAAQLNVSSLHGSLVALESSTSSYNAILAEKEDTIQQLTTQLSQMDAKLTRLRRVMPVTVSQNLSGQQHAQAVRRAIENVMSAVESSDPTALPRELAALEQAVNEPLQKLFPGEFLTFSPSQVMETQPSLEDTAEEGAVSPVSSEHSQSPTNALHSPTTAQAQNTLLSDEAEHSPIHIESSQLTSSEMDQHNSPLEDTTQPLLETPPDVPHDQSASTQESSLQTSSGKPESPTLFDDIDYPLVLPDDPQPLRSLQSDTQSSIQPIAATTLQTTQATPPTASWDSGDHHTLADGTGSLLTENENNDIATPPTTNTYPPDNDDSIVPSHHDEATPPLPPNTFPNTNSAESATLQEATPTSPQSFPPPPIDTYPHEPSITQVTQHAAPPPPSLDTYPSNLYTTPTALTTEAPPSPSTGTTQISHQEEAPPPPIPATPPPEPSEEMTSDEEIDVIPEANVNLPLYNTLQPTEEAGIQSYSPVESPVDSECPTPTAGGLQSNRDSRVEPPVDSECPTPTTGGLQSNRDSREKEKMSSNLSDTFTVGTMTDALSRNEDDGHIVTSTPSHQLQSTRRDDPKELSASCDGYLLKNQHQPSSKMNRDHEIPTTSPQQSRDSADYGVGEQTHPFSQHQLPRIPFGGSHWDTPPSSHLSEPKTNPHERAPHTTSGQETFNEAYFNIHQLPKHLHDSVNTTPNMQHEQPDVNPATNTYHHHYHQPPVQTQQNRMSSSLSHSPPRNGVESPSVYDEQKYSGKRRSRTPQDRHTTYAPLRQHQQQRKEAQVHRTQDERIGPSDYARSTPGQTVTQPQPKQHQYKYPSQNRQHRSKRPGVDQENRSFKGSSPSSQPEGPRVFVAVMDYDPNSLCVTGDPGKELSIHTGDVLAVHGEMDSMGYYTASFGNQTGLVPANFVQEMDIQDQRMRERLFNQKLSRTTTPLGTLSYASMEDTPTSWDKYTTSILLKPREMDCPQPPSQFQVEKALGHSVLLVSWQTPTMDSENRSNECLVTGYQIYVNGETKMLVSGAKQSKALLPGLKFSQPLSLGVSTSSVEGKSSEMVTITYKGRPHSAHSSGSNTSETESYRMFVALYDYDPIKSSPSDNPEFELPLKEGELIKVFGKELSDGFLVGEINDRRGLVPANFVSEVNRVPNKQPAGSSFNSSQLTEGEVEDGMTSPKLPTTSKKMAAVFDYNPDKDSPNPNPELELSFKTGDTITVYGNMHSDGFYSGELNGEFGLVPSNFLKEVQGSTPSSPTYTYTTTPTRWSQPAMTHNGNISASVDPTLFTEHDFHDMLERTTIQSSGKRVTEENERPRTMSSPMKTKSAGQQPKKKRSYGLPFRKDWVKSIAHKKSEPELI